MGLVLALGTAEGDFLAIDDNDIIATVHGGGEGWFVLAAQAIGNNCGQAAYNQSLCIDQHPIFHNVLGFRRIGAHVDFSGLLMTNEKAQEPLRPFRLRGD
jgi:hypothetical protein